MKDRTDITHRVKNNLEMALFCPKELVASLSSPRIKFMAALIVFGALCPVAGVAFAIAGIPQILGIGVGFVSVLALSWLVTEGIMSYKTIRKAFSLGHKESFRLLMAITMKRSTSDQIPLSLGGATPQSIFVDKGRLILEEVNETSSIRLWQATMAACVQAYDLEGAKKAYQNKLKEDLLAHKNALIEDARKDYLQLVKRYNATMKEASMIESLTIADRRALDHTYSNVERSENYLVFEANYDDAGKWRNADGVDSMTRQEAQNVLSPKYVDAILMAEAIIASHSTEV